MSPDSPMLPRSLDGLQLRLWTSVYSSHGEAVVFPLYEAFTPLRGPLWDPMLVVLVQRAMAD